LRKDIKLLYSDTNKILFFVNVTNKEMLL